MNQTIWNGIGQISDNLIIGAQKEKVRAHFKRRKRNLLIKYGSFAACLCLAVCLCVPLINMIYMNNGTNDAKGADGTGLLITGPAYTDNEPIFEGYNSFAYSLFTDRNIYHTYEQPILNLSFGLVQDNLGNGNLKILINTGDFTTTADTEITIDGYNFTTHSGKDTDKIIVPLTSAKSNVFGTITINFLFYPDDITDFRFAESLNQGAMPIGTIELSYMIDEYEIVLSYTNAHDLYERRLAELYKNRTITEREFADRYFAFTYRDTVCASVSVTKADGSYSFIYRSKNIRYDSPYITDIAIKEAMNSTDEREIIRLTLEYIRDAGVITQTEYDDELVWVTEVRNAGKYDIGFSQNVAKFSDVLQKNMYTHN